MSVDKTVKNVLILMNSYETADSLSRILSKMGCACLTVNNIADAQSQLKTKEFYALIFVRTLPLEEYAAAQTDSGIEYVSQLIAEQKPIKLGYYGSLHTNDQYEHVIQQCVHLIPQMHLNLRHNLRRLVGNE